MLYKQFVAYVPADSDSFFDDVRRAVRAEIRSEVGPLVEAQAKTQH